MKECVNRLAEKVSRSWRWFTETLEGILRRVMRWLHGPPSQTRTGRCQLNLTDDELKAVTNHIEAYPSMGGKKGACNLAHDQAAWIGAGSYDAINDAVAQLVAEELKSRQHGRPDPKPYEPPTPKGLNEVLAGDIFEVKAWDVRIDVCDFLDVHNQEYLALEATLHAADSAFVAAAFEVACKARGGKPPTVATKTDRGSVFKGLFAEALKGLGVTHEQIPPGCPWFNGESERGHRDLRSLIMAQLSKMKRPAKGKELAAVKAACAEVQRLMNEVISKPSLGNVTPREITEGKEETVREETARYVERQREERRARVLQDRMPLLDRLRGLLGLQGWDGKELLRFLRLSTLR